MFREMIGFYLKSVLVLPIIVCLFIINSCSKDNDIDSGADYTIFGHFYGECSGEQCVEIFKIEAGSLFEDTNDYDPYANQSYDGNFVKLDDSKFEKVKNLPELIPDEIYAENNVVGQPDAGDWGGIFLETRIDGQKSYWKIDMMHDNLPEYLCDFVDTVVQYIAEIQ